MYVGGGWHQGSQIYMKLSSETLCRSLANDLVKGFDLQLQSFLNWQLYYFMFYECNVLISSGDNTQCAETCFCSDVF